MSSDMMKIIAQIESETGLKAFESYMDLKWAEFYANLFGPMIALTVLSAIGLYAIKVNSKKSQQEVGDE